MSLFCPCSSGGIQGNTGVTPNALIYKNTKAFILVQRVDDDGNENVINASDFVNGVLPQSFIDAKLNHSDASKRWFLVKDFDSITAERADPITEQRGNSNNTIIDLGVRTFQGVKLKENESEQRNYERLSCLELGVFQIDSCGTMQGYGKSGATVFKPLPLGKNTFYSRVLPGNESTSTQIQIQYEFKKSVSDGDFIIIPSNAITDTDGYLLDEARSLQNMLVSISNISTTGFTADLSVEAGNFNQNIKGIGWTTPDFALYNNTDSAVVVITSVTEVGSTGVYTFVVGAQDSADNLTLSGAISGDAFVKAPYELQNVSFDIP